MKTNELITAIQESYKRQFPESAIFVKYEPQMWRSIGISCFISGTREECHHGYWVNDLLKVRFSIVTDAGQLPKDTTPEGELPDNLELEVYAKSYLTKPTATEPYNVYSSKRLKFRKTKGDAEKITKTLDKYFQMLRAELEADVKQDNITADHIELLKAKLI